jgi:hypothetical protein
MTTVWGDDERFVSTYFSTFPAGKLYSTFDWATRDADGYYFMLGRTDDVINVAGHRLGTREIEEGGAGHSGIAEVAVVGVDDRVKGQVPIAFAVVKNPSRVADEASRDAMAREVMADRGQGARRNRAAGAGSLRHAVAEDALGQAPAPLDPGAGRSRATRAISRRSRIRRAGADPRRARDTGAGLNGLSRRSRARTAHAAPSSDDGSIGDNVGLFTIARMPESAAAHVPLAEVLRGNAVESIISAR